MSAQRKSIAEVPQSQPIAASVPNAPPAQDPSNLLERMLAGNASKSQVGQLSDATISKWSGHSGILDDDREVFAGASCLLRPEMGDRVLIWCGSDNRCFILNVLQRANKQATSVWATDGPIQIEAPRVGIKAKTVHISGNDFVSTTRNRFSSEDTRTETARLRVADVKTDIRRSVTVHDEIKGSLIQRTGTWVSRTVREARLHARTFLFD